MSLTRAQRYATQFVQLIERACLTDRIAVAGEVRRLQAITSQPLEIVAVPITVQQVNLFDEPLPDLNELANVLTSLISTRRIEERFETRTDKRRPNVHPKRLLFRADGGMLCPVDLWEATEGTFGAVLALRTGPYGYRSSLTTQEHSVTPTGRAGLLPRGMQCTERDGLVDRETGAPIPTTTEDAFFRAINRPMHPPEQRR